MNTLDQAEELVTTLERNGARLDHPWMTAVGARCRSMMLAARGDLDGAEGAALRALVEHQTLAAPFERARTQLLLGQLQRRMRHRQAARITIEEALTTFERLGTPIWVARAAAELARIHLLRGHDSELTAAERRVAELAATGMTNKDVAAALFISPKTVESNLGRVYRKLGIRTRVELGRRLSADDSASRTRPADARGRLVACFLAEWYRTELTDHAVGSFANLLESTAAHVVRRDDAGPSADDVVRAR